MTTGPLIPRLEKPDDALAIRVAGTTLTYRELAQAAGGVARDVAGMRRVAVYAALAPETIVAVVGALAAGVPAVMIGTHSGAREVEHVLTDSDPDAVLAPAGAELPEGLRAWPRLLPRRAGGAYRDTAADHPDRTALIIYTSGTTGLPKGVEIPRRAIASNVDALADAWAWTSGDGLVHALPLFHAHGLILGTLGPLRLGGRLQHVGRFSAEAVAAGLRSGGTMLFGVPTMYSRLADACKDDRAVAAALAGARLLVSGSAPLPAIEHRRLESLTGQRIVERYGLTETLMNAAVRVNGDRAPGYVGPPLSGVELQLVDEDGGFLGIADDETFGEIVVRGPNIFSGYLNRPDATEAAMRDGWFLTGDLATRRPDGYIRILGRHSIDLIKSGGYKIGAGEVEGVLLEHPAVSEVAVKGLPDPELGEHVVAWVVTRPGTQVSKVELVEHVAALLSTHKRPRDIRFVAELPRNAMGKVMKQALQ